MGLTRLGRLTLTLVVLALVGYWLYTNPEARERFRPRFPPPVPPARSTPAPPPAVRTTPLPPTPAGASARERGRQQYEAGDYAGAIASLGRAITASPFDIESIVVRENAFARLPGRPVWRVAVAGPFTGPDKQCGQQVLFGVYYAQRQANQAGRLPRKIVVDFYDDQASAEAAIRVAQAITADQETVAVVGHCNSRATLAAGPLYEAVGVPMITATSTNPDIANLGEYIFRVVGDDNDQARALANALWQEGRRTVAVFVDNEDAYSRGLFDNFARRFTGFGGRVFTNPFTIGGEISISTDLREADAILVTGEYADAGKIARLVRDLGVAAPIVGGDAVYSQGLFAYGGEAARGVRATAFYHYTVRNSPLLPRAEEFARRFEAVIHAPPNHNMATAYDAASLLLKALAEAGGDRAAIQGYLAGIGRTRAPYLGVTGKIAFDENGEAVGKPWVLVRARERDFVADTVIAP